MMRIATTAILAASLLFAAGCARTRYWLPTHGTYNAAEVDEHRTACDQQTKRLIWIPLAGVIVRAQAYNACMERRGYSPGRPTHEQIVFDPSRRAARYDEDFEACRRGVTAEPLSDAWNEEMRECMGQRGQTVREFGR